MLSEPLDAFRVKTLLRAVIETGRVVFSRHALKEMEADDLTTGDALNVLRAGAVEPGEFENGSWRYRLWTPRMTFVVAFRSETEVVIVTAWRTQR